MTESISNLLALLVVFGLGGLLCYTGYEALTIRSTRVKGYKITGRWAQFVGVLFLIVGVPLILLSLSIAVMMIVLLVNSKW